MTLLISRIILTLFLSGLTYLVWVNNVDLVSWGLKKSKELLPITDPETSSTERKQQTEKLANFIKEAQSLGAQLNQTPLPIADHNAWVERVEVWLRGHLGAAYVVLFSDFSGMAFYGDGSDKSQMSRSLEGRSRRLREFIAELSR